MCERMLIMIITGILLHDTLRSLIYGLLSVLLTYCTRNDKVKARVIASCVYFAYVTAGFAWVFIFISIWGEAIAWELLFWGLKWICLFIVITIIQHFYYHRCKKGKDIMLLIINAFIMFIACWIGISWFPL